MMTVNNPVLSGFYPDPSICAVGNDFYLVNSTFAYFPGIPIFHSRDLAHWDQIGNVLDRSSQVCLEGCRHSQGIYAPTIRYHKGMFYVITTNVSGGGSFIVTAEDPAGSWSEPYFLGAEAPGIDPSLFFDSDGVCYYVGTRPNPEGVRYNGDWEIWAQELDLAAMKLTGESHMLWKGAMNGAIWPEGPHLYRKDGFYYLLIAEGGTSVHHSVMAARSRSVFGPYEGNPANPILTHRHLGRDYPVVNVGHGDLVEDPEGRWYMVMLASRPCQGHTNMGRETFLAKVVWEDGWPVVNPGVGKLEDCVELPEKDTASSGREENLLEACEGLSEEISVSSVSGKSFQKACAGLPGEITALPGSGKVLQEACAGSSGEETVSAGYGRYAQEAYAGAPECGVYRFRQAKLPPEFMMLRNPPREPFYRLEAGKLYLRLRAESLREEVNPSYLCVRQRQQDYETGAVMEFEPRTDRECAGLAIVQSNFYHIRLEMYRQDAGIQVRVVLCREGQAETAGSCGISGERVLLRIVNRGQRASFYCETAEGVRTVAENVDMRLLSTETAGGFTGCTMGMYASSNGAESRNEAVFTEFYYKPFIKEVTNAVHRN